MLTRRSFLGSVGAAVAASPFVFAAPNESRRLKMAVVTTEWRYHSHAWHMAERFLAGYPINGHWHHPSIDVVSAYVDQFPENDLSREREAQFGFKIYPTVAEAVRNGGDKLAVDAVLLIGEHGDYPDNEFGQKMYPRYELFKQVADVYREDGRSVPVFNDKHLSWKWEWAEEMVALSEELKFPFLAGSSLPMTWRMPSIDMPMGADIEEIMCVAIGGVDSYDFHALEVLQCMAERRRGGETGVVSMHAIRGDAVWDAMKAGSWADGGWAPQLFEACLSRSQTLHQGETYSHRYPTEEQMREWVKEPVLYRYEHADGLKASMLIMNGLVGDFTFAAKLKGQKDPLSTLFYLPPNPNVVYSAALMSKAEEMYLTGKAPFPIERTLLTTGLVASGMESLSAGQKLSTPHLDVSYRPPAQSQFWQT
ncbi:MAG: hypothetical protein KDA93_05955 [Planctomycetaceae bacterium]|nr:hypothetical protein [Planctomycetaceae bacterium]